MSAQETSSAATPDLSPYLTCSGQSCSLDDGAATCSYPPARLRMVQGRRLCAGCFAAEGMQHALGEWAALPAIRIDDVPDQEILVRCAHNEECGVWPADEVGIYRNEVVCIYCFDEDVFDYNENTDQSLAFTDLDGVSIRDIQAACVSNTPERVGC